MRQPTSFHDQVQGKATAELYRGSGAWPAQPFPVDLEPPFDDYCGHTLTAWDCYVNRWEGAFKTGFLGRRARTQVIHRLSEPLKLRPTAAGDANHLVPVSVAAFAEDESTIDKVEQFLRSLSRLHYPASFELIGLGAEPQYDFQRLREVYQPTSRRDRTRSTSAAIVGWHAPRTAVRFIVDRLDANAIGGQLQAHYPNSAVVVDKQLDWLDRRVADEVRAIGYGATLELTHAYVFSLKTFTALDPDPLGVVIAAFDQLVRGDWALLQTLFTPVRHDWAGAVRQAIIDPYKPEQWLVNGIDERTLREKFSAPLFAVAIRLAARRKTIFDQLVGWAKQFSNPPQELAVSHDDSTDDFSNAIGERVNFRPGMLLNAKELAALVHVPATTVASERLTVVRSRTRPAPRVKATRGSILLGHNVHRGVTVEARVSAAVRPRHLYVAGASGSGKSTLLLNLIVQDIEAGRGIALLDPHGDLCGDVLARIPARRIPHTVLFDPTDTKYPPSLNILHTKDAAERDRLVNEVVETLKRFSTTPWGARFEYIFKAAVATIVRFRKCTLWDVRRILLDPAFRQRCVSKISEPNLLSFWHDEFPKLPKGSIDPILNRMQRFLLAENVRNVLCQREALLDFDDIINSRRIFLANLSTGLLTREVSGVFGALIIAKLLAATFRRAAIPREKRAPFQLVVDEFQAFMADQLSIGFEDILAEARKFALGLALANQYVDQLTPKVRAAVFGNVATLVAFRMGVKDAHLVSDEFGAYSAEELMSLEVGQAVCRVGGTQTAFNLQTLPPPPPCEPNLSGVIRARCRQYYARPRHEIDAQFLRAAGDSQSSPPPSSRNATGGRSAKQAPRQATTLATSEPWDIWSDFVS